MKRYYNSFFLLLACLTTLHVLPIGYAAELHAAQQSTITTALTWEEVVEYAQETLPQEGVLIVQDDGFVYVDVDDDYIHALFPLLGLEEEGFDEPPYFRNSSSPGAHISVFYVDERIEPEEVGQTFHFELREIVVISAGKANYAILQVYSPELEELRAKYGLKPKLQGHEFHISLAKKKF